MDHFLKPGALLSTVVFLTLFLNDSSCHSFIGVESHFQLITGYGGVLSTAVSCQPGVVSDPESTLIPGLRLYQPSELAWPEGVASERTPPGHEPRTMRLLRRCIIGSSRAGTASRKVWLRRGNHHRYCHKATVCVALARGSRRRPEGQVV